MSISSEEVNYLVYRYLQEAGFTHSAFTFANESLVLNANINGSEVATGSLISYLQKGLQYKEIETHLGENGKEINCTEEFNLLTPHVCQVKKKDDKGAQAAVKKEIREVTDQEVQVLHGHSGEVFVCAWNPKNPTILSSGSGDATARIWTVTRPGEPRQLNLPSVELKHVSSVDNKDVTTLDWHPDGSFLATGCYDGVARIWNWKGDLVASLDKHRGPVFSLRWNKKGDSLLSGSVDKTAIIWDPATAQPRQIFEYHKAPTLDVDWRDDISFASCSTDKLIYVCELGQKNPIACFQGHQDEVNAIRWDPSGRYLASCSDDLTVKIWNMKSERPLQDFRKHTKEIYAIRWSPSGQGTENANKPLMLASASFDATVKIWDINQGDELFSLNRHTEPVYSVAFSPNAEYLASGSFDKSIHIWSLKDGSLVRTYKGQGGVFEICWNPKGDQIAASFSNNTVCVIDMRM